MTTAPSIITTNSLLASVAQYLREKGLRADFREDGTVSINVTLESGMRAIVHIIPDMEVPGLLVYGYATSILRVPEERRAAVAEYLTRANYGIKIGNFELDMRDGEVRYKTSVPAWQPELAPALIHDLFRMNVYTMTLYTDGLTAVIFGEDPLEAIRKAEGWLEEGVEDESDE